MKKSIFKRIVSAALALTMLASMAVGMSTSVSAATNAVPGKVNLKLTHLTQREYKARDYMADPDKNPYVTDITIEWNKVENAKKYRVRVIYKTDTPNIFIYKDFETSGYGPYYYKLEGLPFLGTKQNTYNISVTAINSNGVEGPTTNLYESESFGLAPCMPKANKYYTKNYVSSTSAKITLIGDATMFKFGGNTYDNLPLTYQTQGYKLTFTDKKTNKNCFGFAYNSNGKTCTVRNLEYGHTYSVKCQSFVLGYAGKAIYGDEVKINDYKHVK